MSIYQRIKQDHDRHRELLDTILDTSGDSAERQKAWDSFYYDVKSHAAAEEETLYADLVSTEGGQPDARHSVHEHQKLDKLLDELNDKDMSSSGWLIRFKALVEDYEHHMAEEENDIFPAAKAEVGADKSNAKAKEFEKRKDDEIELVDEKDESALEHQV